MSVLGMCQIVIGILFIGFGYAIYFKGKYKLINGWVDGKLSDRYARRVGKIELIGGSISVGLGIVMCMMTSEIVPIFLMLIWVTCMVALLIANQVKASKEQ